MYTAPQENVTIIEVQKIINNELQWSVFCEHLCSVTFKIRVMTTVWSFFFLL